MAAKYPVNSICSRFLFFLLPAFLAGCTGLGVTTATGIQFNQIAQENNQRAQKALAVALEQTCDAAQPYRDAAQNAAAASATLAAQSASQTKDIKTALDQRGALTNFLSQSQRKIDESWSAYESARAQFEHNMGEGLLVIGTLNLGNVIADAGAYTQAMINVGRAYETVAMDLESLAAEMGGKIDNYLPEGVSLGKLATDLRTSSKSQLDEIINYATSTEYDVPADTNIRVDQLSNAANIFTGKSMWSSFQKTMQNHVMTGSSLRSDNPFNRNPADKDWNEVRTALEWAVGKPGTGGSIDAGIVDTNDQIATITDRTQELSAEATRNAWLAVEACGGTLPSDLPPLASPFDGRPDLIPGWNSTFWDISSP